MSQVVYKRRYESNMNIFVVLVCLCLCNNVSSCKQLLITDSLCMCEVIQKYLYTWAACTLPITHNIHSKLRWYSTQADTHSTYRHKHFVSTYYFYFTFALIKELIHLEILCSHLSFNVKTDAIPPLLLGGTKLTTWHSVYIVTRRTQRRGVKRNLLVISFV